MSRLGKSMGDERDGMEGVCVLQTEAFPGWQSHPAAGEDGGGRGPWLPAIRNAVNATDLNWKMAEGGDFMCRSVVPW